MVSGINIEILVVGIGGTGGTYLKELARFIYSLPDEARDRVHVSIVDGDRVEKRNIGRQPFIVEDIGEYKTLAMHEAIEEVFGFKVYAFPEYIKSTQDIQRMWYSSQSNLPYDYKKQKTLYVLVGCVDNHHARKVMHDYFVKHPAEIANLIYLDSANEYSVGEVVIAVKNKRTVVAPDRKHYYPNIFKGPLKSASELSCLEINEIEPQHIVTNMMAANILLSQTVMLFEGQVNGGIVLFDALKAMSRYQPYEKN